MANRAAFTESFLRSCRCLGRVRLVLRNAVGLSEVFADLERLEVAHGWANLVLPGAHMHLTPRAFGAAAFRMVSGERGRNAPAIWLYGAEGCPLAMIILDQTSGEAMEEQAALYGDLRREFGPFFHLISESACGETTTSATNTVECSPLH